MQYEHTQAEDSSLKNQLAHSSVEQSSSNTPYSAKEVAHDVEKHDVKAEESPAPVAVTANNPNHDVEKGVLERSVTRETHTSNISTANEEKDDFPEGGLKAWSVVLGAFCGSFR